MFIVDDILAAKAAGKLVPALVGIGLTFGAGFGAAELCERRLPWGLGHRLERLQNSVDQKVVAAMRQGHAEQLAHDVVIVSSSWRPALAQCESARLEASRQGADYLQEIQAAGSRSRDAAYRLGAASCRGSQGNASTGTGQRSGAPAGGLRDGDTDLRDTIAGAAYRAPTH